MQARMAPLIIAEWYIILFLIDFIAGIICCHQLDHIWALGEPFQHSIFCHFYPRGHPDLATDSGGVTFVSVDGYVFNHSRRCLLCTCRA